MMRGSAWVAFALAAVGAGTQLRRLASPEPVPRSSVAAVNRAVTGTMAATEDRLRTPADMQAEAVEATSSSGHFGLQAVIDGTGNTTLPGAAPASSPTPAQASSVASPADPLNAPPRWRARPPGEWQGMLVDMNASPFCESTSACGLAQSCRSGKCVACEADTDCAEGEQCVLDHCLKKTLVGCRSRSECRGQSLCVLSGYSSGLRGNEDMRSFCNDNRSGAPRGPAGPAVAPAPDPRKSLPNDDLLQNARQAAPKGT
jgi:hypothetical protein